MSRTSRPITNLKLTWPSKPNQVRVEPAVLHLARVVASPDGRSVPLRNRLIEGDNLAVMAALLPASLPVQSIL